MAFLRAWRRFVSFFHFFVGHNPHDFIDGLHIVVGLHAKKQ
jgi:hypothetical protein